MTLDRTARQGAAIAWAISLLLAFLAGVWCASCAAEGYPWP